MIAEFNSYMSNIDIDFFKELCLKHGELRHYKKNEFILHEGDACSLFIFQWSTVALTGGVLSVFAFSEYTDYLRMA